MAQTTTTILAPGASQNNPLASNKSYLLTIAPAPLNILEFEDLLFHKNSAVMMPAALKPSSNSAQPSQGVLSGIKALAYVFKYAADHPEHNIVIAGHTDATGGHAENYKLSGLRAQNVRYLLLGYQDPLKKPLEPEGDSWAGVCEKQHIIEDYQQILKQCSEVFKWQCDPGAIDNTWGPKTEAACKCFFAQVFSESNAGATLQTVKNDSKKKWPLAVWKEIYKCYKTELLSALIELGINPDRLMEMRQLLAGKMAAMQVPYVACGMSFPIDQPDRSQYSSEANRRVEIVFIDKEDSPKDGKGAARIACCSETSRAHKPQECPLWNQFYSKKVINPLFENDPVKSVIPCYIDCHMHTNSGKCAPACFTRYASHIALSGYQLLLKLIVPEPVQNLAFLKTRHRDEEINSAGLLPMSGCSTLELSQKAMDQSNELLNMNATIIEKENAAKKDKVEFAMHRRLLVNMPMDMEYLHYGGYLGHPVYESKNNSFIQWSHGVQKSLSKKTYADLEHYPDQLESVQKAFCNNGGTLLSFFHYDPRRWRSENAVQDSNNYTGNWNTPFNYLLEFNKPKGKSADRSDCFIIDFFAAIGFKMYTELGYRPDDYVDYPTATFPVGPRKSADPNSKLPHMFDFFKKCASLKVPITCHCSRGGAATPEMDYYVEKDRDYIQILKATCGANIPRVKFGDEYFFHEYVSPFAWEKVLHDFPDLRLCLAHFGGEESWGKQKEDNNVNYTDWAEKISTLIDRYDNLYVDLSFFLMPRTPKEKNLMVRQLAAALSNHTKLRKRIVLGTDYYLVNMEVWENDALYDKVQMWKADHIYPKYLKPLVNMIMQVDETLCSDIMVKNPLRFLRVKDYLLKIKEVYRQLKLKTGQKFALDWINEIDLS
jgi:predicted TIM-barrel fold metal-dependent hydrolase